MIDNSAFSKKTIKDVTRSKEGFLEELNLPPQVITFIRQNKKNLQIFGVCLVVAILAVSFYQSYTEKRRDESAAQLAAAMQAGDDSARAQALQEVIAGYGRTDAALWGRFELGHIEYRTGKFAEAVIAYTEVLDDLAAGSPLRPLVEFSLAQTHEQQGKLEQALAFYKKLSETPGFGDEGTAGLGRIYERKNEPARARAAYEEYLSYADKSSATAQQVDFIKDKLGRLKAAEDSAEK